MHERRVHVTPHYPQIRVEFKIRTSARKNSPEIHCLDCLSPKAHYMCHIMTWSFQEHRYGEPPGIVDIVAVGQGVLLLSGLYLEQVNLGCLVLLDFS